MFGEIESDLLLLIDTLLSDEIAGVTLVLEWAASGPTN